ncbi:MAG: tRNA (N6-isopentenyl adenosine(37)-C2)-methylthiotransferase MiaB [Acidobacteria bacterium]|nr:MAG: tRNA (N6-isopentenyl adenosine(37)-C2)-methylthiotransferase MiaB [Acidobacteriota bacterium]
MKQPSMIPKRFFIETFGCQMNEHDSEKIAGLLAHQGMLPAPSVDEADLFILNTCSVREKAAQKVYSRLGEVKHRKRESAGFIIGVVGCVAQQEGRDMVRKAPFIDLVVGTHNYHTIPELLEEIRHNGKGGAHPTVSTDFLPEAAPVEIGVVSRQTDFRAAITIMEGCNKHCSFCIVPYTRGKERNRPARAILDEVKRAAEAGFTELLLLGQTVNSYRDPEHPRTRFAELLATVAQVPGIRRVRFTSPHPRSFDDRTLKTIGEISTICDQVHLPLQSGSNRVLKSMRRQHSREWYLELVDKFQRFGRAIRFSTDVIVGFPGETQADFEETLEVVEQVEFESMFSFKYSPRPFTEAIDRDDDVPENEKARRLMLLQQMQRRIQLRLHGERYLGKVFTLLVEGPARDGTNRCGRTTTNKIVNYPGNDPAGTFVDVRITCVGPNSLVGERILNNN